MLFCTLLRRSCTTAMWNDQILSFFWGLERQGDKFYHLYYSELGRGLLSSSNLNSFLLSNRGTWKNREMVWKDVESIFQWRFHGSSRCRIVRSLLPLEQLRSGLQTGSLTVYGFKKTILWHCNIFGVEVWLDKNWEGEALLKSWCKPNQCLVC